jgi:hypothetical protein
VVIRQRWNLKEIEKTHRKKQKTMGLPIFMIEEIKIGINFLGKTV